MVLPDSHKIPRVPWYLGAVKARCTPFTDGTLTRYGRTFQIVWLNAHFVTCQPVGNQVHDSPTTPLMQRLPAITHQWFRLLRVRSPLLTESLLFSTRPATKMFQFTGCPLPTLCVQVGVIDGLTSIGLPHSDTRGSSLDCSYTRRFVAYHVLLRPTAPRHPPRALRNLNKLTSLHS